MCDWSFEEKVKYIDDRLLEYLESLGYQRNQRIVDHLIGTAYILRDMGALPHLVDAGLFHSVYGEASSRNSPPNSLIERHDVQEVVGKQAEEIVYHFCTIPNPRTENILAMEHSQLRDDLIMLCKANDQEMGSPQ